MAFPLKCVLGVDEMPKFSNNTKTIATVTFLPVLKTNLQSMKFSNGCWDAAVKTVDENAISSTRIENLKYLAVLESRSTREDSEALENDANNNRWLFYVTHNHSSISKLMIYIVIPVWYEGDDFCHKLTQIITSLLSYCNQHSIESVALPIIGHKSKNIPVPTSAQCLLRAIDDFSFRTDVVNLKVIDIVIPDLFCIQSSFSDQFLTPIRQQLCTSSVVITPVASDIEMDDAETCLICLDYLYATLPVRKLATCHHTFHVECLVRALEINPRCPLCLSPLAIQRGNQPLGGKMTYSKLSSSLPGYEACGTICIRYFIPGGVQNDTHPNPGHYYCSTTRTAYLPDSGKGQRVLKLLQIAFERGLTFTVGRSLTLGYDNMITWNDIHHKTSQCGSDFAYPDLDYLDRVLQELKDKGID